MENLHPIHPHRLNLCDASSVYGNLSNKWTCDVCQQTYDGLSKEESNSKVYHCFECKYFDMCSKCFRGYLHPFHTHRLQPADPQLCYPHTKGLWRCDTCQQIKALPVNPAGSTRGIDMYHCSKCQIDLCASCYKGECYHVSHGDVTHPLIPIDPRIYYRTFRNWICSVCGQIGGHEDQTLNTHFHCKLCDEDMCNSCYKGYRHHLHKHNLVPCRGAGESRMGAILSITCSECRKQVAKDRYHLCSRPNCSYYLCSDCFGVEPKPHPLHPEHILRVTDEMQVYPESGGKWHCDNCGETHGPTSGGKMYHCDRCGYDLCNSCYRREVYKPLNTQNLQPTNSFVSPPSSPKLITRRTYLSSKDRYQQPVLAKNFIPSSNPVLPAPELCRKCGLSTAKVSSVHMGVAHTTPIYCQPCSDIVLNKGETCFLCGRVPNSMVNIK